MLRENGAMSMEEGSWDYSSLWEETLKQIRTDLNEQEYIMWFRNLVYSGSDENHITLSVPSSFYRDQIIQRYQTNIEDKILELQGTPLKLKLIIDAKRPELLKELKKTDINTIHRNTTQQSIKKDGPRHYQLKPEYNFENFVIGENNSFAANAAIAIARNPGTAYNPCLIYGGVGLGKTHLIQAIGDSIYSNSSNQKISYITAETFTSEFISSIQSGTSHRFKKKYRSVDILLIDDIHFLQGKIQTQEELFYTFEALYNSNKQMVFTCDRPVSELKELTDRLRSRFERGLNVDLQPPDYETRIAILKKKIENNQIPISEEAIELIAKNVTTNVRDLEAALMKLIAYADLVNKNISLDVARTQLRDFFANPNQRNVSIDAILRGVAEYFGLSFNDLRGKKRTKAIAFPRQIAMYLARELTEYSTTEVGIEFGGRDHTTVMYACQKIENGMKTDSTLEPMIQNLKRKIMEYRISS
jgi:chromosomal replication initiator protein